MSLTKQVIMPREDYVAACDAIRNKLGTTDLIKSGEMAGLISNIQVDVSDTQVYEAVEKWIAENGLVLFEYGTEELEPGVSELATGKVYICYE